MTGNRKSASLQPNTYQGIPGTVEKSNDQYIKAWQRLQYGMFIHWGPYSVLGGEYNGKPVTSGYSEQIQMWANIPEDGYLRAARQLSTESFDSDAICKLAKDAGMRYIVITSKHHDGFAMYDTKTTDYNIVQQVPGSMDPLKSLAQACERHGLKFGIYFSLVDWHQGHDFDKNNNNPIPYQVEQKLQQQLRELMGNYGPIAEVWFDMSNPNADQSVALRNIIREMQPEAVVNSRIWNNTGDFRTLADNQIPSKPLDGAWQTPASIYHKTWGFRRWQVRDDLDGKVRHLVESLVKVIARGGNYLLNVGPKGDGGVVPFETNVLENIGAWIRKHKNAVLGAEPTRFDSHVWGEITVHNQHLFLHVMNSPANQILELHGLASPVHSVMEDGTDIRLEWQMDGGKMIIKLPEQWTDEILPVIRLTLEKELHIIPNHTVQIDENETIPKESIYSGYDYADKGDYNTLYETTVRKTMYFATRDAGEITLIVDGEVKDRTQKYQIEVNGKSSVVTGEQLVTSSIGSFSVGSDEVTALHITLAEPTFPEEELGLTLDDIKVRKNNQQG